MIEQTPLIVTEWIYIPPVNEADDGKKIISLLSLDVMKKTAPAKKGIACRFTCKFMNGDDTILLYIAEDSYVIDEADVIDKNEILTMIKNSYSKVKETFDIRKLGTVLQNKSVRVLDEANIDLNTIHSLLN